MSVKQIKIEGLAEIASNDFIFVCGYCRGHGENGSKIEINFGEQKLFYLCPHCNKMNELFWGKPLTPPLPKSRLSR